MSPVFGHGRLRLYLLKLVDEAPRHGYEVIRLLQDRFMGVYAPSPGTIYPRLARLEEEGLITHDEQDGRKIYRITEKGRAEINRRLDELDELEREITESVSGIAREVKEDVRETVRSLREELTWATREMHREARRSAHERARQAREDARARTRQVREEIWRGGEAPGRPREQERRPRGPGERDQAEGAAGRRERPGWQDFADWAQWAGRRPGSHTRREFESLAREFGNELRSRIRQAGALGEGALEDLRLILDDALERIRRDVFGPVKPGPGEPRQEGPRPEVSGPTASAPAAQETAGPGAGGARAGAPGMSAAEAGAPETNGAQATGPEAGTAEAGRPERPGPQDEGPAGSGGG